MIINDLLKNFSFTHKLVSLFEEYGTIYNHNAGERVNYHQNAHYQTSILLSGLIKLFIENENSKILLYYLDDNKPCIVSYTGLYTNYPVEFSSIVLKETVILTIPNEKIIKWSNMYPELNKFMIFSYQFHYISIVNAIKQFISLSLECRLFNYLKTKSILYKCEEIKIPLQEISLDLNFTIEAISRGLKKLENNQKIIRKTRSIILLQ